MKKMMLAMMTGLVLVGAVSAAEVDNREWRQQGRIAHGVASGQLTPWETGRLERQEGRLRHEIYAERHFNGGYLTPYERYRVNRQENRLSNEIYRYKHNGFYR